jgi:hypothetical protein
MVRRASGPNFVLQVRMVQWITAVTGKNKREAAPYIGTGVILGQTRGGTRGSDSVCFDTPRVNGKGKTHTRIERCLQ